MAKVLIVDRAVAGRQTIRQALAGRLDLELFEADTLQLAHKQLDTTGAPEGFACIFLAENAADGDLGKAIATVAPVPAIALTPGASDRAVLDLLEAGACACLAAPEPSSAAIAAGLWQALRLHRAASELLETQRHLQDREERARPILEGFDQGIWDLDLERRMVFCNEFLCDLAGLHAPDGWVSFDQIGNLLQPDDRQLLQAAIDAHLQCRLPLEVEFRLRAANDEYRDCLLRGQARATPGHARVSGTIIDITERRRSEERSRFLAAASQCLSASLEPEMPLASLAELAIPFLADWCAIDLLDAADPPRLQRIAASHSDPERLEAVWALQAYTNNPSYGSGAVMQTGRSDLRFHLNPGQLSVLAPDSHHRELLATAGCRAYLCVPLLARDRPIGTLWLARATSPQPYTYQDLVLAEDIARRAALAVENTRLYREAQVANTNLRRAMQSLSDQQQQLRALQQLTSRLNQRSNLTELLQTIAAVTCEAIASVQVCAIALVDGESLQLAALAGSHASRIDGDVLTTALQTSSNGNPCFPEQRDQNLPTSLQVTGIHSAQTGRLGTIAIGHWQSEDPFSESDRNLLQAIAEQASIAADNARLLSALEEREGRLESQNRTLAAQNSALAQQQQKIYLQNLELLQAARLKTQFLATMSHELRTPMNAIIGFSQVLQRQAGDRLQASQSKMLERILSNGKNLLQLIDDILDLSKMEASSLQLRPKPLHLPELVQRTLDELRSLADEKLLTLTFENQLSDPSGTNDGARFRQVLVNLLSNAIKFTEAGGVIVSLQELDSGCIEMAVRDTGIGMSPDQQQEIFKEFWQVDQSTTRRYSGTGLGLAIADSLVRLMSGAIAVESELGIGSTFRVTFPRHIQTSSSTQ